MTAKQKTADEIAEMVRAMPKDPGLQAYEVIAKLSLPLPIGAIKVIAEQLGIPRFRADQAAALRAAFEADPKARAKWEPLVLSGVLSIHRALVRARPGTEGTTAILKPAGGKVADLVKVLTKTPRAKRKSSGSRGTH